MSTSSPVESVAAPATSRASWTSLLTIAALCGVVPALWNLTLLEGLHRSAYLIVYFALSTGLSFGGGALVAAVRPRLRAAEIILLALMAGAAEAFIEAVVVQRITINGGHLVLGPEDYVAWAAVVLTFAAGGLFGLTRRMRGAAGANDLDVIRRRDMLMFATKLMGVAGPLLSLYVTVKKGS
ncbi:MAG: hypothetical protein QOF83_456 [Solirubrobacteraceae bacterium]|jgi:hypothetical protein|nr:hypothetical protein [Solirubrobacteraceae bacterium]